MPTQVKAGDKVEVAVDVENSGKIAGEEVVEVYLTPVTPPQPMPIRWLAGFERVSLRAGERRRVHFTLTARQFATVSVDGRRVVEPGVFEVSAGGKQPGAGVTGLAAGRLRLTGTAVAQE
jgi:beta-glucosidase